MMEAVRYTEEQFGVRPRVMMAPDGFGHPGNLPQLARSVGAEVYYQHRANPGFRADGRIWQAWEWEGDDGTRLLAVGTPVYLGPVTATRLAKDVLRLGFANDIRDVCFFYGIGDHGGGPTRQDLLAIRALGKAPAFPAVGCSTVMDYVTALRASRAPLPVARGGTDHVFEGCYTTHGDSKRLNRDAERALASAELLAAQAGLDCAEPLSEAWRAMLLHQFHDILCGTAVREAFTDQLHDTTHAIAIATDVRDRALARLAAGWGDITVTNTNPGPWTGATVLPISTAEPVGDAHLIDDAGRCISAAPTAGGWLATPGLDSGQSLGLRLVPGPAPDLGRVSSLSLDRVGSYRELIEIRTNHLVARVDPASGIVTGLKDPARNLWVTGRETAPPESGVQSRPDLGLAVLEAYHELPHPMTSWVTDLYDLQRPFIGGADVSVAELSAIHAVIEARHHFEWAEVTIRLIFYADLPWFEVEAATDWKGVGSPEAGVPGLAIAFGTLLPVHALWTETPFAAAASEPNGYLVPTLRWAVLAGPRGGLAVANDSKHGVDALGPRLRYHLVRGAYDPDPVSDAGRRDLARFAVRAFAGDWRQAAIVDWATAFNSPPALSFPDPLLTRAAEPVSGPRPRLSAGSEGAQIAGLMPAGGRGLLLRLYESWGQRAVARMAGLDGMAAAIACDITGRPVGLSQPIRGGRLDVQLGPFEVATLLLTAKPPAPQTGNNYA
jgi:alpha-mannosidase